MAFAPGQPELASDERLARARLLAWQKREDEAIDVYLDAILRFPQRVEAYQELVRLYLERGDVERTIDILRQGHVAQPAEAWFAWILAQLAQQAGWYEEARGWYLKAGKLDANDADAAGAFVRAADIALQQDRRRAALLALQQAVQRDPRNAQAYFLLGELRERQHKLREAAEAYTQATTLAPNFGEAYRARGRIYGRLSDLQSLDTMTQEVLALNPNEAYEATIVVADTFRQASEYRRAEEAYRQAIHLRPEQPDAQLALASLLEQRQRLAESAALYQQAATRLDDPQAAANAWGQAGRLLVEMTQYAAAITAFTAARTAEPENAGWHEALGDLYERSGNLEPAAASYDRARALNPNNPEVYVALARVARAQNNPRRLAWMVRHIRALNLNAASEYNRLLLIAAVYQAADDSPRAVTAYQNAMAAYPQEPDAYWELIRLWIDQEQLDEALAVASSMSKQPGLTAAGWLATGNVQVQRSDLVAAEDAFRHAVTAQPASPEAYLEMARLYDTTERPAEAVATLRQGLKALPHDVPLLAALAERLSAQGQRNDAIGLLQRAARWAREPADVADIHWRIGDLWLQEGYADRAEQAWRRALAQNPDHAKAYWSLGQLRQRAGQLDDALALYTRATEVAPKYREAYAARGRILASRGDLSGITRMAEELAALYLDPSETYQAHLLLASIYGDAGHYEAAARELNTAIPLDTSNPEGHIQLGWVYEVQQQWSKARAAYERVGQLVPDLQRNVALRSGQLYVNEGNLDAAIRAFLEGIELAPDEPDGYLSLARLYENQGRLDEARATYAQMLSRGPAMASLAHQALGTLAERQGDIARAEDEYQQALAITPQDSSAHLPLANFYEATSQWDKAVAAYQRAAELDPSQATNPLLFAANIQRQLGQTDELQVTCNRVVALVDAMPSPDYHALRQRGLAFAMQGDFVQAEQGLRRALAVNPDDLQAQLYLAVTLTALQRGKEADQHLADGLRLAQRRADLVYALREAEVLAAYQPPLPGASALLERMQAAYEQLPRA